MSEYDASFFAQITDASMTAANVVVPWVLERVNAHTVIDVGCGTGAWAAAAQSVGCTVKGVDAHVPDGQLLITEFERMDLGQGVDCSGYDLAMTLEVAEHLPESSAQLFVDGLCKARYILWSAAIPGQGGLQHINEQWSTWWEPFFASNGYVGSCDIRWAHWDDRRVAGYYRQNLVLWARPEDLEALHMTLGVTDDIHPDREIGL